MSESVMLQHVDATSQPPLRFVPPRVSEQHACCMDAIPFCLFKQCGSLFMMRSQLKHKHHPACMLLVAKEGGTRVPCSMYEQVVHPRMLTC